MNIMMLLEMVQATFPERKAFTDGSSGTSYTYQELFEAARLRERALRPLEPPDWLSST